MTQWGFQNKGKSGWTGTSSFVLEVPKGLLSTHSRAGHAADGSETTKPIQRCAAGLHWLKGLYYVVLQERQDPSDPSEGLTHSYIVTKQNRSYLTTI